MAKNKPKTPNQKLFQKEIKNLIKRVKSAEKRGFDFPEDIIPEQPKVIRKSLIERIKNLRGTKLLKKALSYFTEEQIPVTPTEGIRLEKEKRRKQSKLNAVKNKLEGKNDYLLSTRGKKLVQDYTDLTVQDPILAAEFIHNLSEEDFDLYKKATKLYADEFAEREQYGRIQNGTGRETGEAVLPDEGSQHKEDSDIEEAEDFDESEGTAFGEDRRKQNEKDNEEIDEAYDKWKENFEREKNKPRKDRKHVYDGDAIYYNMIHRIEMFEGEYNSDPKFKKSHELNNRYKNYLRNKLDEQIAIEKFPNVMRRLDGKGIEIDEALGTMLYATSSYAVTMAYMQLYQIIKGGPITQQEGYEISSISEFFTGTSDDEDSEGIEIER